MTDAAAVRPLPSALSDPFFAVWYLIVALNFARVTAIS